MYESAGVKTMNIILFIRKIHVSEFDLRIESISAQVIVLSIVVFRIFFAMN